MRIFKEFKAFFGYMVEAWRTPFPTEEQNEMEREREEAWARSDASHKHYMELLRETTENLTGSPTDEPLPEECKKLMGRDLAN